MLPWIEDHETLLWSLTALGVFMFFATLVAIPVWIARLPVDYFVRRGARRGPVRRPFPGVLFAVARNGLGVVLLLAGLAMLVLPGQGLLAILVGVMLLDFPGKRRFERWLICRPPVFRAANWIRRRRDKPPLERPA